MQTEMMLRLIKDEKIGKCGYCAHATVGQTYFDKPCSECKWFPLSYRSDATEVLTKDNWTPKMEASK